MVKLFGINIRPEVGEFKYYIHIAILVLVVLLILKFVFKHDMLSLDMFWKLSVAVIAGDILAHSILRLD